MKRFLLTSLFVVAMVAVMAAVMPGQSAAAAPAADCTGTSASVYIGTISATTTGTVSASGAWSVGGGADGVHLEYRIDNTLWQSEDKIGAGGPWNFQDGPLSVGTHTFIVNAYPKKGVGSICWTHGSATSSSVTVPNPNPRVSISCTSIGYPVYQCTGQVTSGGTAPFTPYWNYEGGTWYQDGTPGSGPWTRQYVCKTGSSYNIGFKVTDNLGHTSNEAHTICNGLEW